MKKEQLNIFIFAVTPFPVSRKIWELYGQTNAIQSRSSKMKKKYF